LAPECCSFQAIPMACPRVQNFKPGRSDLTDHFFFSLQQAAFFNR